MKILDAQGRLFGKLSILDVGAALIILLVIFGIFLLPGPSGTSVAQIGITTKPIEVDALVLGLGTRNAQSLLAPGTKANFVIRNQPYGQIEIKAVQFLPRTVTVSQPDGSVKALPDPRPEANFSANLLLTLEGKGQVTKDGPVLGNSKIKVGTPVELEGQDYRFNASVIEVRIRS